MNGEKRCGADDSRITIVDFLFSVPELVEWVIFDLRTVPELVERVIFDLRTFAIGNEIIAPEGRNHNSPRGAIS
jgi:hypothetical protein